MKKATSLLLVPAACIIALHTHKAGATTYNVVPDTDSSSAESSVYSLSDALEIAEAGDTILLGDGSYTDQIHSVSSGEEGNPITITGTRDAVMKASTDIVLINHSWITLEGFSVDGVADDPDDYDSYTNKCVVVDGLAESEDDALQGFVMKGMLVQNCGGECVRLKNFVVNSEITGNEIYHCGIYDYEGNGEGKNGEGIYIGTPFSLWEDYGADMSNGNWIVDNTIATYGNECVEVKEGSSYNIVEYNICSEQLDEDSGCLCSRGDENTFRYNDASDCVGVGIRLGGWEDDEGKLHGQNNEVHDNTFVGTGRGAMAVRVVPQAKICGNTCESGSCGILKDEDEDEDTSDIEASWDVSCEETSPTPSTDIITPSPAVDTPAPVDTTPSPTSETPSPVISTPSPIDETPAPSARTPSPVPETPSPVVETPSPSMETPSPIGGTPSPVQETPSPLSETHPPTSETPSPVSNTPSPVLETPSPRSTPSPIFRIPSSTDDTPPPVTDTPSPVSPTPSPADTDDIESYDDDEDDDDHDGDNDDDDDDNDNDGDDDANDDYQSDDDDDDDDADDDGNDDYESDDDGNDDYESDDEGNDDYESDDDDDANDDYQSDDDDSGNDDNGGDENDDNNGDDDGDDDHDDRRGRRSGGRG